MPFVGMSTAKTSTPGILIMLRIPDSPRICQSTNDAGEMLSNQGKPILGSMLYPLKCSPCQGHQ